MLSTATQQVITITFFAYTAALIAIAFFSGRSMAKSALKNYVDDFYTGGRGAGVWVVALITAAGICSSGTFIGGPGLDNARGLGYSMINFFSFVFTNLIVLGTVGKKLGIIGRRIDAATYIDVLMARFNNNKILLVSSLGIIIIFLVTYCSSQFMGGARMLEVVTGLDYKIAALLFAVVVVAYSTFGGMKGVGLAAILQGVVMTVGALALGIATVRGSGGLANVFYELEAHDLAYVQPQSQDFRWMASLWVTFGLVYLAMPHGTLSCLTYKNTKSMHKAILLGAILIPIWSFSMNFSGLASVGQLGVLEIADHTTPLMAAANLHPVLAGLTIAGAAAAAQSTISAMILAISGTFVRNVYEKLDTKASPKRLKTVTMLATLAVGIATFIMALDPPAQLEFIVMFAIGGLASAFFFPMALGLYWPRMNQWGAVAGVLMGLAAYMTGKSFYTPFAMGMDAIVVGLVFSLIGCLAGSFLTKPTDMRTLQIFWGAEPPKDAA